VFRQVFCQPLRSQQAALIEIIERQSKDSDELPSESKDDIKSVLQSQRDILNLVYNNAPESDRPNPVQNVNDHTIPGSNGDKLRRFVPNRPTGPLYPRSELSWKKWNQLNNQQRHLQQQADDDEIDFDGIAKVGTVLLEIAKFIAGLDQR
jgi:hypothetical protein